jgi:L-lactate dehydrogenase complex protein LldG
MSTAKDSILTAIRRNRPVACAAPDLSQGWTTYADRRQQFIDVLSGVGGLPIVVATQSQLNEQLRQLPTYTSAKKIVSLVPGVGEPNVDLAKIDSPHALEDVDIAILPAEFAVAENGAVWISDAAVRWRVIYFLCQHLVLVVPPGQIVDHLHAAYERLATTGRDGRSQFAESQFGAFISGPSKTADIEQNLVIGAHGARSLTVFLLEQ